MAWQIPELNLLVGSDKNALQDIFLSLQRELSSLESRIAQMSAALVQKEKR